MLKLPTLKAAKAMLGAGKESKKAAKTVEAWLMSGAVKLARHIRMDEYKRASDGECAGRRLVIP